MSDTMRVTGIEALGYHGLSEVEMFVMMQSTRG